MVEVEEIPQQVRVAGQMDEVMLNSGRVPVDHASSAQLWASSLSFVPADRLHSCYDRRPRAGWSVEPVRHDTCDVENLESLIGEPHRHRDLFQYPVGPGHIVVRHVGGSLDVEEEGRGV